MKSILHFFLIVLCLYSAHPSYAQEYYKGYFAGVGYGSTGFGINESVNAKPVRIILLSPKQPHSFFGASGLHFNFGRPIGDHFTAEFNLNTYQKRETYEHYQGKDFQYELKGITMPVGVSYMANPIEKNLNFSIGLAFIYSHFEYQQHSLSTTGSEQLTDLKKTELGLAWILGAQYRMFRRYVLHCGIHTGFQVIQGRDARYTEGARVSLRYLINKSD